MEAEGIIILKLHFITIYVKEPKTIAMPLVIAQNLITMQTNEVPETRTFALYLKKPDVKQIASKAPIAEILKNLKSISSIQINE